MAVMARLNQYDQDRTVDLQLYIDEPRLRVTDNPPLADCKLDAYISFYWDDEKLETNGEYELLGVEILDVSALSDRDIHLIESLDPPRLDFPELGLHDVSIGDALRHARAKRQARVSQLTTS